MNEPQITHACMTCRTHREVVIVCCNSTEREVHGLLREGGQHDYGFEKVSNRARERAVMSERSSRDDTRLEKDGST